MNFKSCNFRGVRIYIDGVDVTDQFKPMTYYPKKNTFPPKVVNVFPPLTPEQAN